MPRILDWIFGALFLLGAIVQYNDPDPLRWMLIYLAAATSCVLAALGRVHWSFPAAVALGALLWAVTLAPQVLGSVEASELIGAWEMKDARIEVGREMYGLLIIAAWMSLIVVVELRGRARHPALDPKRG
jgi:hypothetical protein